MVPSEFPWHPLRSSVVGPECLSVWDAVAVSFLHPKWAQLSQAAPPPFRHSSVEMKPSSPVYRGLLCT